MRVISTLILGEDNEGRGCKQRQIKFSETDLLQRMAHLIATLLQFLI